MMQTKTSKIVYVLVQEQDKLWEHAVVHSNGVISGEDVDDLILVESFDNLSLEFTNQLDENENGSNIEANEGYPVCACLEQLSSLQDLNLVKTWRPVRLKCDGYLLSCIFKELKCSPVFRTNFIRNFISYYQYKKQGLIFRCNSTSNPDLSIKHANMKIKLSRPQKDVIDYAWNYRMLHQVRELCILEVTMAQLSTLGGAFSSLGDYYMECAKKAGEISFHQLMIAMRLGDPITVSRCKIYAAISCVQTQHTAHARRIIREQYKFATSLPPHLKDNRLINMCRGVWARLQYLRTLKRKRAGRN